MTKLILASGNSGKIKEFKTLLNPLKIEVLPQSEFDIISPPETGTTFVENAIIKARAAANSGFQAIADDSGLVVDALNGAPGVYSARYAGVDADASANNQKLLNALKDVPDEERSARFICVIVLMRHQDDPLPLICQGIWEGMILKEPEGNQGFGYDPIFWCKENKTSAANLPLTIKNTISHRGKALTHLLTYLNQQ